MRSSFRPKLNPTRPSPHGARSGSKQITGERALLLNSPSPPSQIWLYMLPEHCRDRDASETCIMSITGVQPLFKGSHSSGTPKPPDSLSTTFHAPRSLAYDAPSDPQWTASLENCPSRDPRAGLCFQHPAPVASLGRVTSGAARRRSLCGEISGLHSGPVKRSLLNDSEPISK